MARHKYEPPLEAAERDRGDYHRQVLRSELVALRQDLDHAIAEAKAELARIRAAAAAKQGARG